MTIFAIISSPALAQAGSDPADLQRGQCEQLLRSAICVAESSQNDIEDFGWDKIKCDALPIAVLNQLMSYYDEMPTPLRPTFCTLKKIFVSDGINSVEFTDSITDSKGGPITGGLHRDSKKTLRDESHHA